MFARVMLRDFALLCFVGAVMAGGSLVGPAWLGGALGLVLAPVAVLVIVLGAVLGAITVDDDLDRASHRRDALTVGGPNPAVRADAAPGLVAFSPPARPGRASFPGLCPACDGHGEIWRNASATGDPQCDESKRCPACGGSGLVPSNFNQRKAAA